MDKNGPNFVYDTLNDPLINGEMLKLLMGLILTMLILTLAKGKDKSPTTPEPIICQQPCTSNGVCDSNSGECKCNPGWMGIYSKSLLNI